MTVIFRMINTGEARNNDFRLLPVTMFVIGLIWGCGRKAAVCDQLFVQLISNDLPQVLTNGTFVEHRVLFFRSFGIGLTAFASAYLARYRSVAAVAAGVIVIIKVLAGGFALRLMSEAWHWRGLAVSAMVIIPQVVLELTAIISLWWESCRINLAADYPLSFAGDIPTWRHLLIILCLLASALWFSCLAPALLHWVAAGL